eukprot:m.201299 g.201299  ORF g.201299 m.201299 type:complete len:52 (-) comp25961_c0_seq6:43-198(-)
MFAQLLQEVGNADFADDGTQANLDENQAHFSMWCITSSPLIAGPKKRRPLD